MKKNVKCKIVANNIKQKLLLTSVLFSSLFTLTSCKADKEDDKLEIKSSFDEDNKEVNNSEITAEESKNELDEEIFITITAEVVKKDKNGIYIKPTPIIDEHEQVADKDSEDRNEDDFIVKAVPLNKKVKALNNDELDIGDYIIVSNNIKTKQEDVVEGKIPTLQYGAALKYDSDYMYFNDVFNEEGVSQRGDTRLMKDNKPLKDFEMANKGLLIKYDEDAIDSQDEVFILNVDKVEFIEVFE